VSAYKREIAVGVAVAIVAAAILGYSIDASFPKQVVNVSNPISVFSNRLIVVGEFHQQILGGGAVKYPPMGYAIWEMRLRNNLDTNLRLVTSLYEGSIFTYVFNSTNLAPKQSINITACAFVGDANDQFVAKVIGFNGSGDITPEYPVTKVNATNVPYSGQFSVSNNLTALANSSRGANFRWSTNVTNNGNKAIDFFMYRTLINSSSSFVAVAEFNCTPLADSGDVIHGGANALISPLAPGQRRVLRGDYFLPGFSAGQTYKVTVVAGYSDGTQVSYSVDVLAAG